MNLRVLLASFGLILLSSSFLSADDRPQNIKSQIYKDPKTGIQVLRVEFQMPRGEWGLTDCEDLKYLDFAVTELSVIADLPRGRMAQKIELNKRVKRASSSMSALYWAHRQLHDPIYKANQSERNIKRNEGVIKETINKSPWPQDRASTGRGPYFLLVDGIDWTQNRSGRANRTEIMIIELHPYLDDGKHYIMRANGRSERVKIDPKLLKKYGIEVTPIHDPKTLQRELPLEDNSLHARLKGLTQEDLANKTLHIKLKEYFHGSDRNSVLKVDLSKAQAGEREIFEEWVRSRADQWSYLAEQAPTSALSHWLSRHHQVYDLKGYKDHSPQQRQMRDSSLLNILGGRAAIQETLQLQAIQVQVPSDASDPPNVPIQSIAGVEVKSHDYHELLEGKEGGRLPLAEWVPADRFFAHFSDPKFLGDTLETGLDFAFNASSMFNASSLKYELKDRYFKKFGVNEQWVKALLKAGIVKEIGIVVPDLFFIDGTDISVIMTVPEIKKMSPMLLLLQVVLQGDDAIFERQQANGSTSYWAKSRDKLIISTNKIELQRILDLNATDGKDSLGKSEEFRYMLTQLAPTEKTKSFIYFSDPFIRQLVGPQTKIGQYRRLQARATLESINAAALHAKVDGIKNSTDLDTLIKLGYARKKIDREEYSLSKDGVASSKTYGSIDNLKSILDNPVTHARKSEHAGYKTYVRNYSQFWRQFFDPIAIRLDEVAKNEFETEVFILPLIDSSIYQIVRQSLKSKGDDNPLRIPNLGPEPVLLMSMNFTQEAWIEYFRNMTYALQQVGIQESIFDYMGPAVHFAVLDSDPVIALGSGDLFGGTNGGWNNLRQGRESLAYSFIASMLTRPCKAFIQVKDEEAVKQILRDAVRFEPRVNSRQFGFGSFHYDLSQYGDGDEWIITANLFGIVKYRIGVGVQDGFLVITNQPWNKDAQIDTKKQPASSLMGAKLTVAPGAGNKGLAGLYAAAMEQTKGACYKSEAYLAPIIGTGASSVEEAQKIHKKLFGFVPAHPGFGKWKLDQGHLESKQYGSVFAPRQPKHKPGDTYFGLLRRIHNLSIELQMEDEGLRTRLRWKIRKAAKY